MVARLELSKGKEDEDFSTNMSSEPRDAVFSPSVMAPDQPLTYEIEEVTRDSTVEPVRAVEG